MINMEKFEQININGVQLFDFSTSEDKNVINAYLSILKELYYQESPYEIPEVEITKDDIVIGFDGWEDILKECKLSYGVHHLSPSPVCEKLFIQLTTEHNQKSGLSNEKGLLLTFLNTLGKSINNISTTNEKIEEAISFITTHYNTEISIKELADSCDLSQSRFMYLFKEKAGQSPHAYQQMLRINNCMTLLASTQLNITDICMLSGYTDPLYFSKIFKKYVGMSPREYRKELSS